MDKKREKFSTSLFPEYKTMLNRLSADLGRSANIIIEEGIELAAKKHGKKSDTYLKFQEKR